MLIVFEYLLVLLGVLVFVTCLATVGYYAQRYWERQTLENGYNLV